MTTKINYLLVFTLFALLSFTACQDEDTTIINPNAQEAIAPNSPLANLMLSTSANSGAFDNILDGSSCFSIELPVTIVVSDITITIETEADLDELEDLFEDLNANDDFLDFIFPITIIFSDYTELVIENVAQFETLINECVDNDDSIECVNFVYPISFSVFNSVFNLIDTVVIENDQALYEFLDELSDDENALIVSLNYPVTLEYANGEVIEVNTNQELADAIEAASDDCDDEDNQCSEEDLLEILLECPWDFSNGTDTYHNYQMIFYADGSLAIPEGIAASAIGGTWNLSASDNGFELIFSDLTAFQEDLEGAWLVIACNNDEIVIQQANTTLQFDQDCENSSEQNEIEFGCFGFVIQDQECDADGDGEASLTIVMNVSQVLGCTNLETDVSVYSNEQDAYNRANPLNIQLYSIIELSSQVLYFRIDDINSNDFEIQELEIAIEPCSEVVFNCFDDFEIVVCEGPNNVPVYNLSANTIGLVDCVAPFSPSFHATLGDAENNTNPIENTEAYETLATQVYLRIEAESGNFEIFNIYLNTETCADFDCFVDTELTACSVNNDGTATFNLILANQECGPDIAIYGIYFYETLNEAQNNTNPISNPDAYTNTANTTSVYGAVLNVNSNTVEHIFTVNLIPENCDLFACFQSFDAIIELCDEGTDGIEVFDLTIAFANCTPGADVVAYYESQADAESGVNPISNPEAYTNITVEQNIFIRVEIDNQFEVFPIQLRVVDCNNNACSEEEVDSFLLECIWNAVNYNGSDNLSVWNFDFESTSQIVIIYTETQTIDASWSTSQSSDGVIVEFSNVSGPNIQAISGSWLVVECAEARLELHRGDDILVLERNCD